jgi:hypothetical protein
MANKIFIRNVGSVGKIDKQYYLGKSLGKIEI